METVTVRDLRNNSAAVLGRVGQGETLTVTRDGQPVATVAPLPRPSIGARILIERRRALTIVDAQELRADIDEIVDSSL